MYKFKLHFSVKRDNTFTELNKKKSFETFIRQEMFPYKFGYLYGWKSAAGCVE